METYGNFYAHKKNHTKFIHLIACLIIERKNPEEHFIEQTIRVRQKRFRLVFSPPASNYLSNELIAVGTVNAQTFPSSKFNFVENIHE